VLKDRYEGWLTVKSAAVYCRLEEKTFRRLIDAGVFTRGRFSAAPKRPPIYLKVAELDAWKRGGADAVAAVRKGTTKREGR
jgi:hypothetical protein